MQIHDVAGSVISCLVSSNLFFFLFQFRKKRIYTGKISLPLSCDLMLETLSREGEEEGGLAYRVCLITIAFFDRGQPVNQSVSQSHSYHITKIFENRRQSSSNLDDFVPWFFSSILQRLGQNDLWERKVYSTGWKVRVNSYLRREKLEEIVAWLE